MLYDMIANAMKLFPGLAYKRQIHGCDNRAEAAADLVEQGKVHSRGVLPFSGIDEWDVDGHVCSFAGHACDCHDATAPVDVKLGRLCKHRLAVMFTKKLNAGHLTQLERVFKGAQKHVILEARTYYAGSLEAQKTVVIGWRVDDGNWQRAQELNLSMADFERMLDRLAWRVRPGGRLVLDRHHGGRERWTCEPMPAEDQLLDSEAATAIGELFGRDAETVADHTRRAQMKRMYREEMGVE